MTDQSIPELMYTMFSLLFLLLGIVLIASIVMSTVNPYEQVAFANVEKIRAAMDQACAAGDTTIKFELPQNKPMLTSVFNVVPMWIINTNGDPNYVLYYESYTPGDAIGWEFYQGMQNRLVTAIPDGWEGKTMDDVDQYVKEEIIDKVKTKNIGLIEGAVVSNIILNPERSDYYLGERATAETAPSQSREENLRSSIKKYGDWQRKDERTEAVLEGDNYFKFNNYLGLNSFEKSAAKYVACGANALCLKTRSGVYRFDLGSCGNIKSVQMVYDARNRGTLYTVGGIVAVPAIGCAFAGGGTVCATLGKGVSILGSISKFFLRFGWSTSKTATVVGGGIGAYWVSEQVLGAFLSYKIQDFSIASPCSINQMTIERAKCNAAVPLDWAVDHYGCKSVKRSQLYKLVDGKLADTGKFHYTCTEKVNTDIENVPLETFGEDDYCLQVKVTERAGGFCWTPDPSNPSFLTYWSDLDTQLLTSLLFFTPVKTSLAYVENAFVLKYYSFEEEGFFSEWKRKIGWAWPG